MKEKRKTTSIQTLKPTTFLKEELASALSRITQEHILGSGMCSEPMLMLAKNNKRKIGKKKRGRNVNFLEDINIILKCQDLDLSKSCSMGNSS